MYFGMLIDRLPVFRAWETSAEGTRT